MRVLDERDQAPVGELRDQQGGEEADALGRVEGAVQDLGDRREQREPVGRPVHGVLGLSGGRGERVADCGGVVRRTHEALGRPAETLGQGPAACLDPADRPVGQDHAIVGVVCAARRDGALEGEAEAGQVVGVDASVDVLDGAAEGPRVESEQLEQPRVAAQPVRRQVPHERADAGGVDGDPPRLLVAEGVERFEAHVGGGRSGVVTRHGDAHPDVVLRHPIHPPRSRR